MSLERIIVKAKHGEGLLWRLIRNVVRWIQRANMPFFRPLHLFLGAERRCRLAVWRYVVRKSYSEPVFKAQCERVGPDFMLTGGIPFVMGNPRIILGARVRMHGGTVIAAAHSGERPALEVGDDSYLGYGLTFRLARRITIGKQCIIADGVSISDTDGHPLDWAKRAQGEPPEPDRIQPVVIEDNVWVGTRTIILKKVRIGRGAVLGAGSVVTKDVPPFAVCAGNPARVIRILEPSAPPAPPSP